MEFESSEEINNYLLRDEEVQAYIARRAVPGVRPMVAMVFFDEETEEICEDLGYDLILPSTTAATPRLQDHHHPDGQRGGRAQRPQPAA